MVNYMYLFINIDLYIMNQWPCPCYETGDCSIQNSDIPYDENEGSIEIINENEWKLVEINEGDEFPIFKYEFKKNESEYECPLLYVEFDKGIGTLSLLISYNRIPIEIDRDWYIPYFSKLGYSLCPGHPNFKYGNYYLTFINQLADVKYHYFRIRIRRIASQICPINDDVIDDDWLQNGVGKIIELKENEERKFHFKALINEDRCTNFSVSANSHSSNDDVDIILETELSTHKSEQDGNAAINFIYCDKNNEKDYALFNITIKEIYGSGNITVVATTEQYFPLNTLINDALYSQFAFTNSFGNFPSITCGNKEIFHCLFPTYSECSNDQYHCCSNFFIITPTNNNNPLIPWNEDDELLSSFLKVPFNVTKRITPRTIAWGLLIESDNKNMISSDLSTCIINHESGTIVNKNYEMLDSNISFTSKKRICIGKDSFQKVSNKISNKIYKMSETQDFINLTKYHIELNELMFSNEITGCVDYLKSFIEYNESFLYSNGRSYSFDIESHNSTINKDLVKEQCHSEQCSINILQSYIENEQFINNPLKGCSSHIKDQINNIQTQFISTCWNNTMTEICIDDQNREVLCNSDLDFINCLLNEVNQTIARILFDNVWNYEGNFTKELFEEELKTRYIIEQCNGPNAIQYREHYWYRPFLGVCDDGCIDPRCFDTLCPIPDNCIPVRSESDKVICYRYWYFMEKSDQCEEEKLCNWDRNIDNEIECGQGFACINCDSNCNEIEDELTCINNNGVWIQKEFYSVRSIGQSFDVRSFLKDVQMATDFLNSHLFSTEGSCRYTTSLSLIESLLCDCFDNNSANNESPCFDPAVEQHIANGFSCDSLESYFSFDHVSLKIPERAFHNDNADHNSCHSFKIFKRSAYSYQIDPSRSVSSSIFQNLETNEFWVVQNNRSVVIGQILSHGYHIKFEGSLDKPIELCIDATIQTISQIGKVYSFAYLNNENEIVAYGHHELINYDDNNKRVCGPIWNNGIYFAIIAVQNYEEENATSRSMIIQNRIGAALYFLVIIFAIIQFIRILVLYRDERNYKSKLLFIFFVFLNSLVRAIYLLSTNNWDDAKLAAFKFFIFEFPSILFFSVFLAIIYLWLKIVNQLRFITSLSKLKKANTKVRIILYKALYMHRF